MTSNTLTTGGAGSIGLRLADPLHRAGGAARQAAPMGDDGQATYDGLAGDVEAAPLPLERGTQS